MWKHTNYWAIASFAIALFILLQFKLIELWVVYAFFIILGLALAGFGIRIALTQLRSAARFERLCRHFSASTIGIAAGAAGLFGQLDFGLDSDLKLWMSRLIYASLALCMLTYCVWHHYATKAYGNKNVHPDFAEDDKGNPVRPN